MLTAQQHPVDHHDMVAKAQLVNTLKHQIYSFGSQRDALLAFFG